MAIWAATFAFTIAQARYLEPTRFGQLSLALAYAAFVAIVVEFGTGTQLSRMVAQRSGDLAGAAAATMLVRSALWLAVLPLLWLASLFLGYDAELRTTIVVLAFAALLMAASGTVTAYLQGREEFLLASLASIAHRLVVAAVGITVLVLVPEPSLVLVAMAFVAGSAVSIVVLLAGSRRSAIRLALEPRRALGLFRAAMPIGAYFVVATFYFNVDLIMLERLAPAENVGWYAAAYRLFNAATIVEAIVVGKVLYPVFSRLSLGPRAELRLVIEKALTFLTLLGGAAVLVLVLCAEQIVALLYPAESYAPAANALRLLAPGLLFLYLNSVLCFALFGLRHERRLLVMAIVFAVFNTAANFVAIPLFAQDGAAVVTTLTELGLLAWLTRAMPRDLLRSESVRVAAKAGVAALAAALLVVLSGANALATMLPLALSAYAAALVLLRAVAPADLRAIAALVSRRETPRRAAGSGNDRGEMVLVDQPIGRRSPGVVEDELLG